MKWLTSNTIILLIIGFSVAASAGESSVPFSLKAETCLNRAELWEQLEQSMANSLETWFWPNHLSEVNGDGLTTDSNIDVTYKWLVFANTYSYRITNVDDKYGFTYESIEGEHAFQGGASISIIEEDDRLFLLWEGQYLVKRHQWVQKVLFNLYTERFFKQLKHTLKASCD